MGCKKIALLVTSALFCLSSYAQVTMNLVEGKRKVVSSNTSVAISYENYVRAQKEAKAARLALLPSFSVDLFLLDYQYIMLRSIIPEPSRFFSAAASAELVGAADLNRLIVKRNILEDFEKNYYLLQMRKSFLPMLAQELEILEELEQDTLEAYELGAVEFSEYYQAKRTALGARSAYLGAEQLIASDELGMKLMLEIPNDTELVLENEDLYNGALDFPESSTEAESIAVNNSKEIETYYYTINAARKMKKGVAISWLSWSGVGFDYFARNSIAKSNIRKLENERTKTIYETRNQVSKLYQLIENQKKKIEIQERLVEMADLNYEAKLDQFNELRGTKIALKKAEISTLSSKREYLSLEYELEILYISLKRILGTTMISNEVPRA
tara:strand:+ start:22596 stop:23750 length:1155 start_codon:yes stop_codon:yes gene_type:complete